MPVTARLSKAFYERLGEQVTNELVEWFNAVDATYKADLRDLVEIQAQRFDAKLEHRLAEVKAELREDLAALKVELLQAIGALETKLGTDIAARHGDLLKWMFVYWAGTALTVIGLLKL